MVSASSVIDCGFKSRLGQPKNITLLFAHIIKDWSNIRAKTGWLEIKIMCPSGATCLPVDCSTFDQPMKIK